MAQAFFCACFIVQNPQSFAQSLLSGSIEGTMNYPSEFVPKDMRVCAVEVSNSNEYCTTKKVKSGSLYRYSLKVPVGEYYVYAVTNDPSSAAMRGYKAFYTEFVTCGLLASCSSHSKIRVSVGSNAIVKNVDPQDWYN